MAEIEGYAPGPKKSVALTGVVGGNTAVCTLGRTGNDLHSRGYDILALLVIQTDPVGVAGGMGQRRRRLDSNGAIRCLHAPWRTWIWPAC
jgi:hypothetical protein